MTWATPTTARRMPPYKRPVIKATWPTPIQTWLLSSWHPSPSSSFHEACRGMSQGRTGKSTTPHRSWSPPRWRYHFVPKSASIHLSLAVDFPFVSALSTLFHGNQMRTSYRSIFFPWTAWKNNSTKQCCCRNVTVEPPLFGTLILPSRLILFEDPLCLLRQAFYFTVCMQPLFFLFTKTHTNKQYINQHRPHNNPRHVADISIVIKFLPSWTDERHESIAFHYDPIPTRLHCEKRYIPFVKSIRRVSFEVVRRD